MAKGLHCAHYSCGAVSPEATTLDLRDKAARDLGWVRLRNTWPVPGGTTVGFYFLCPYHAKEMLDKGAKDASA